MNYGSRILEAIEFGQKAHHGQTRYNGSPYFVHCLEVGFFVALHHKSINDVVAEEDQMIAALLHDTIEDTTITFENIRDVFGARVANLVQSVTNPSIQHKDKRRAERKMMDREHYRSASLQTVEIKLADIYSNLGTIMDKPDFAPVFVREKLELYRVLLDGQPLTMLHEMVASKLMELSAFVGLCP